MLTKVLVNQHRVDIHIKVEGCSWDEASSMFDQSENTSRPAEAWSWVITSSTITVPNHVGWPNYNWMPDGHISTLQVQ